MSRKTSKGIDEISPENDFIESKPGESPKTVGGFMPQFTGDKMIELARKGRARQAREAKEKLGDSHSRKR